ncbi:MAG: hypothetical protein ABI134_25725 [Byssovorax sp.]
MINENAPDGNMGNPGLTAPGQAEPGTSNTPAPQRPAEVPQDPNEVQNPPPREIPPAPEPNEGDRERA